MNTTRVWVLDASVLIKTLFVEPGHEIAISIWDSESRFIAPVSALTECANTALKKVRHEHLPEESARDGLRQLHELPVDYLPIHAFNAASLFDIARSAGVTAHDAVYLMLAEDHDAVLLTADERLLRATGDNPRWKNHRLALSHWPS